MPLEHTVKLKVEARWPGIHYPCSPSLASRFQELLHLPPSQEGCTIMCKHVIVDAKGDFIGSDLR